MDRAARCGAVRALHKAAFPLAAAGIGLTVAATIAGPVLSRPAHFSLRHGPSGLAGQAMQRAMVAIADRWLLRPFHRV